MIEELRIRDVGVIEDAVLELGPGFTAITGETGAGKTMVLTGLSLLFGGKADSARVRAGADKAQVDGSIVVPQSLFERLDELDVTHEDGALLISRTVAADGGRGKAILGGRPVPTATLAHIADDVVAIHGQADQRRLLQGATQRGVVDRFAGIDGMQALAKYRQAWQAWNAAQAALQEFTTNAKALRDEAADLSSALEAIDLVKPQPFEDVELKDEASRLAHGDSLRKAAGLAHEALTNDDRNVVGALAQARRILDQQRDVDSRLGEFADSLKDPIVVLTELTTDLAAYLDSVDTDPTRLEWVEHRRAELNSLMRKLGKSLEEILQWKPQAAARLAAISDDGSLEQRLIAARDQSRKELESAAAELTALRTTTAAEIAKKVSIELAALSMGGQELHIDIRATDLGPFGGDDVVFCLAHGKGQPVPLGKGASGGELSRIMLALEVVVAASNPVPVMVFDEVDAGVGGKSAVEVGRRLCRLAAHTQVLVVTHLPQVAAFADRHVVVAKSGHTSAVRTLSDAERITETARMLAGLEDSGAAQAHAQELLAMAQSERDAR